MKIPNFKAEGKELDTPEQTLEQSVENILLHCGKR